MKGKCLVCGYVGSVDENVFCPSCETLLMPTKKKFYFKEEEKWMIESESRICFGMWSVIQYRINGGIVYTCDCPAFIKQGNCKHIQKVLSNLNEERQNSEQEQGDVNEHNVNEQEGGEQLSDNDLNDWSFLDEWLRDND
ncbi:MAG: hypothetical protein QW607_11765 [Desulfurococcaceae archaeon]